MPISLGVISSSVDAFSPVLMFKMSVEFRIWNGLIIFNQNTAFILSTAIFFLLTNAFKIFPVLLFILHMNHLVYIEWESRVHFVTIFGDQYQSKRLDIYNNVTNKSSSPI